MPISETGFLSHFNDSDVVEAAGRPDVYKTVEGGTDGAAR
jgi:hypothetical protein